MRPYLGHIGAVMHMCVLYMWVSAPSLSKLMLRHKSSLRAHIKRIILTRLSCTLSNETNLSCINAHSVLRCHNRMCVNRFANLGSSHNPNRIWNLSESQYGYYLILPTVSTYRKVFLAAMPVYLLNLRADSLSLWVVRDKCLVHDSYISFLIPR